MAKETIYGFTFVLVLATVFGGIVVRKLNEPQPVVAATEPAALFPDEAQPQPGPAAIPPADKTPRSNGEPPQERSARKPPVEIDDFEPVDFAALEHEERRANAPGPRSTSSTRDFEAAEISETETSSNDPFDPFEAPQSEPGFDTDNDFGPAAPGDFEPVPTQAVARESEVSEPEDDPFFPAPQTSEGPPRTAANASDNAAYFGDFDQFEPAPTTAQTPSGTKIPAEAEQPEQASEPFDPFASDPVPVATKDREREPVEVVEPEFDAGDDASADDFGDPFGNSARRPAMTADRSDSEPANIDDRDEPVELGQLESEQDREPVRLEVRPEADDEADPFGESQPAQNMTENEADPFGGDFDSLPSEPAEQSAARMDFGREPANVADREVPQPLDVDSADNDLDHEPAPAQGFADFEPFEKTEGTAAAAGSATSGTHDPASEVYIVEPNENFWTISRKVYGTARFFMALARYNAENVSDPKRMRPGTKLLTPPAQTLVEAFPDMFPQGTPSSIRLVGGSEDDTPGEFFVDADGVPSYRIGTEDTLSDIAQQHLGRSSRWLQIYEMNRDVLKSPNDLKIGLVLRLPSDASSVRLIRR